MNGSQANIVSGLKRVDTHVYVILSLLLFGLFSHLGVLELSGEEPRRATVALEMMTSGDFIVPHAYGVEYFNKPPAFHWFVAAAMTAFGVEEFAVRLPGVLSFLSIGFLLFYWVAKIWSREKAAIVALLYLTSADLVYYATVFAGEIDLTFSLFLFINAIGIYSLGRHPKRTIYFVLTYLSLLIAIWTKGWLAIHFHALTLIVWLLYVKQWRVLFSIRHLTILFSFIALLLISFLVYDERGELTHLLLNNFIESGSKITATTWTALLNQVTETPFAIFKIALPWSICLLFYFKKTVRRHLKSSPIYIFSVIYLLANIWIYWFFIDVRDRYLYAFVPFVCLLIFGVMDEKNWWPEKQKLFYRTMILLLLIRIGYNFIIIPRLDDGRLSDSYMYRQLTDTLLDYTNQQPIDLLTPLSSERLPFEYNHINRIPKQPWVPYQIPFYIYKKSRHVVEVKEKPVKGHYYLVYEYQRDLIGSSDSLYQFEEGWQGKQMVLIRAK